MNLADILSESALGEINAITRDNKDNLIVALAVKQALSDDWNDSDGFLDWFTDEYNERVYNALDDDE